MGHRNPWRISVDSKTNYVYWGEVGPDANEDSEIGPRGYDEMNQARKPGNFGWPWFVADNQAFPDQEVPRVDRGWIMAISMKENGDYDSMERVLPSYHPVQPIDIKFGPDGDLYILEY
eukprot:gene6455-8217_t